WLFRWWLKSFFFNFFFFQAEDGIRDLTVTGVQTCALPISFAQVYAAHAARRTTHGPHVRLVEAYGEAVVRGDEDALGSVREYHVEKFVAVVHVDGVDAVRAYVLKLRKLSLLNHAFARDHDDVAPLG